MWINKENYLYHSYIVISRSIRVNRKWTTGKIQKKIRSKRKNRSKRKSREWKESSFENGKKWNKWKMNKNCVATRQSSTTVNYISYRLYPLLRLLYVGKNEKLALYTSLVISFSLSTDFLQLNFLELIEYISRIYPRKRGGHSFRA